jgi:hypothetical protein
MEKDIQFLQAAGALGLIPPANFEDLNQTLYDVTLPNPAGPHPAGYTPDPTLAQVMNTKGFLVNKKNFQNLLKKRAGGQAVIGITVKIVDDGAGNQHLFFAPILKYHDRFKTDYSRTRGTYNSTGGVPDPILSCPPNNG